MSDFLQEMGRRMRTRRKELRITQEQVADACRITKSTVCRYEKGMIREPHRPTVEAIARRLAVHADWLYQTREDPTPSYDPADVREIISQAKARLMHQEGLMFDGVPVSAEALQSILAAIDVGMTLAARQQRTGNETAAALAQIIDE